MIGRGQHFVVDEDREVFAEAEVRAALWVHLQYEFRDGAAGLAEARFGQRC